MRGYDFGPHHPLKPVRLERTVTVLNSVLDGALVCISPRNATASEIGQIHDDELIEVVQSLSQGEPIPIEVRFAFGFSSQDTPPFRGMWEACLPYCGAAIESAEQINMGAKRAFNIGGGLHHAQRHKSSGFCVFNDCALSIITLKQKFDRVMYIDIDLHHGDGVEFIFEEDPSVLTFSIHETGRTLYPGTGFVQDEGSAGMSFNLPLEPGTTGDTWILGFTEIVPRLIDWFKPGAIVLQCGCDAHRSDPLGHLNCTVQDWLGAIKLVHDLNIPMVVCGGGGYDLTNVPRMWSAAFLTASGLDVPELIPSSIPSDWGMTTFLDKTPNLEEWVGRKEMENALSHLRSRLH